MVFTRPSLISRTDNSMASFAQGLSRNASQYDSHVERMLKVALDAEVSEKINLVKEECTAKSKLGHRSANIAWNLADPPAGVSKGRFAVALKEGLKPKLAALGFEKIKVTTNPILYCTILVEWPTLENASQPSAPPAERTCPFNFETMRAEIDHAITAMARMDPAERSQKLKALRLKWHPDKHTLPSTKALATALTQAINAAVERLGL